jgi:hypothetical protein
MRALIGACLAVILSLPAARASAPEDYGSWPLLRRSFPSTGGGGVVIGEYDPIVIGDRCVTNFTATVPDGTVYRNIVIFEAVPTQGGILCTKGQWGALDGSGTGTTPFEVFIKDGVRRATY